MGRESAQVMQVIRSTFKRGLGTPSSPIRQVVAYWSLEGELLVEIDRVDEIIEQLRLDEERREGACPVHAYMGRVAGGSGACPHCASATSGDIPKRADPSG